MSRYILLLRGINVGGKNLLPMKSLVMLLEHLGCVHVKTYIQSGNAVLDTSKQSHILAEQIQASIQKAYGFIPSVLLLKQEDFVQAMANNPFPEAEPDEKNLHVGFLVSTSSNLDLNSLESIRAQSERFQLIDRVFYLHAPDGIGRSKLAASSEKILGVSLTYRNWRTVCHIRDMVIASYNSTRQ